ncbi:MAG: peptide ABC transporter substrate-binding protein [Simkaniaceae bacterium]|nr:peptide ABC transporter substrate-binding protein [Simkaniaceae bacterium]
MSRILVLLLLCFSLSSCSPSKETKHVKRLRLNTTVEPPYFDPTKNGDTLSSMVQYMLFTGLTQMTEESMRTPALAHKIEVSSDGKEYTFHLRKSYWSDGTPLTAHDFVYAWKKSLNPDFPAPNAFMFYPIKNAEAIKKAKKPVSELGVRAVDKHTIVVELERPTNYFLELTGFCSFFPNPIKEKDRCWTARSKEKFVSNGPYYVSEYKRGHHLLLKKNPYYFNQKGVDIDEIEISFVANAMSAYDMYRKGDLDFIGHLFTPIPVDCFQELTRSGAAETAEVASSIITMFNVDAFPFNNVKMRRAFALAIDRQTIADHILQPGDTPSRSPLPQVLKDYDLSDELTLFDPIEARKLFNEALQELGISRKELKHFRLLYTTSHDMNSRLAQALQRMWSEVLDVHVELEGYEFKIFLDKAYKHDFQFSLSKWTAQYADSLNILDRYRSKKNLHNTTNWESKDYKNAVNAVRSCTDREKRMELVKEAERLLAKYSPMSTICHKNYLYSRNPRLKGVYISPIGSVHFERAKLLDCHTKTAQTE